MSTTRAEVLRALRHWGAPVEPATLAGWINRSPLRVADILAKLYGRDLADRRPHPIHAHRFIYSAKALAS